MGMQVNDAYLLQIQNEISRQASGDVTPKNALLKMGSRDLIFELVGTDSPYYRGCADDSVTSENQNHLKIHHACAT